MIHLIVNEKEIRTNKIKTPKIMTSRDPLRSLDLSEINSISGSLANALRRPSDSFVTVIDLIFSFRDLTLWVNYGFFCCLLDFSMWDIFP